MPGWSLLDFLTHNWAIVAIASTVVVLIAVPAQVLMKYIRIAINIMRSTEPPLARGPLDFDRLEGENVALTAYDGLRLNGMLLRSSCPEPRGLILFAHEFCSDLYSCARYCRPLLDAGYDIFAFDFRGHGRSNGDPGYTPRQWVSDRELYDMRGALAFTLNWLESQGRPRELGVVGVSRGACAAILAAAEDPAIRAIAVDGAFSTDCMVEYFMKRWAYIFAKVRVVYENHPPMFWRFLRWVMIRFAQREFNCRFLSVRKAIQQMQPRPLLFIHGERDSYLPVEQSQLLYSLAAQPKYLWIAPGARHNQAALLHPERYAALLVGFFFRHLASAEPAETATHAADAPRDDWSAPAPRPAEPAVPDRLVI